MADDDWGAEARTASSKELCDAIDQMYPLITGILDGSVTNTRWNGYGTSLVIRCLIFVEEAMDRWYGPGWRSLRSFLIRAQFMMSDLGERIEKPQDDNGKPRMKKKEPRLPSSQSGLVCKRIGCGKGFTNLGNAANQWWVCGTCLRPTEQWFMSQGDDVLNMFRDGPLSGMVYDSTTLLTDLRLAHLVLGYTWTNEIMKSEKTQMVARVWLFTNEQPDSVTSNTPTASEGVTMTAEPTAPPVPDPAPAPAPAPAPEPVDVSDLLPKRNALKLSRTVVAAAAGITVAMLYRIEQGGKRTTADEAKNVRQALVELEADQPAPAPAAAEGENAANPE